MPESQRYRDPRAAFSVQLVVEEEIQTPHSHVIVLHGAMSGVTIIAKAPMYIVCLNSRRDEGIM